MQDKPVTLAAVTGAHGVAGEVRLKLFGEGLEGLKPHKSFNSKRANSTIPTCWDWQLLRTPVTRSAVSAQSRISARPRSSRSKSPTARNSWSR